MSDISTNSNNANVVAKYVKSKISEVVSELREEESAHYNTVQEFRDDLILIKKSLLKNGDDALITGDFSELFESC